MKQVDFSDPLSSDEKEPLVTGPSAPPVKSVDDLTGKEIHVRLSSSYYESLVHYTLKTRQCRKNWKNLGAWWHYLKKYAGQYDFDYLMVGAQAYQESGLDQSKRSPAGAIGVMQLLPSTAADPNVGIPDIEKLDKNIHAGTKYLRFIVDRYFNDEQMDDVNKLLFAFASYNAGPARVSSLQTKAAKMGLNPNIWFQNVEVAAAKEIGRETVQYVSNIYKYYIVPPRRGRDARPSGGP